MDTVLELCDWLMMIVVAVVVVLLVSGSGAELVRLMPYISKAGVSVIVAKVVVAVLGRRVYQFFNGVA